MSKIEWTHRPGTKSEVWNPTTGCDKVSQGCKWCYAEVMHKRLRGMGQPKYQHPFLGHLTMHEDELLKPLRWKKPRTVFVNSMSDLFHKDVSWLFLDKVFAIMVLTQQNTYQILTKRAEEMSLYFAQGKERLVERWEQATYEIGLTGLTDKNDDPDSPACHVFNLCENQWPRPNIWIGVSAEDQKTLNERHYYLSMIPAHVRFISYEPALGPLELPKVPAFSWLIAGGESGPNARPAHPDWFRSVRDQCKSIGVQFFFKQWGEWFPDSHVSYNGPFNIQGPKHYVIDIGGRGEFYDSFDNHDPEWKQADPPITKENNAWWMAKVGKHASGHELDGVEHLEFPE